MYYEIIEKFTFGTNTYHLFGEQVFKLWNNILNHIFVQMDKSASSTIGTCFYDSSIKVGYNPNVLFGKHLGVFGNTGSCKTCTIVSIIQRYIHENQNKAIKFIILDVNGEYKQAFDESEAEYISFQNLRLHHSILSDVEYGKLFHASEGTQYPVLRKCISKLRSQNGLWSLNDLPNAINEHGSSSKNQVSSYLRTMHLRIEGIVKDQELMNVINSTEDTHTLDAIFQTQKKVIILGLQVSGDLLDVIAYLLFKTIYEYKKNNREAAHIILVLEEAHRYIKQNSDENRLDSYYIDKISREGRKFGIGLIVASQTPSMLAYEVVSQCNSVIMHKITNSRDMEFLRSILRVSNDTFFLQMSALKKQYAIICGEAFPNDSIVRIHDAFPLPSSNDPVINDLPVE